MLIFYIFNTNFYVPAFCYCSCMNKTKSLLFLTIHFNWGWGQTNKHIYNIVPDYDECFEKKVKQDGMMGSPLEISSKEKILEVTSLSR